MKLYTANLTGGTLHPNWMQFHENTNNLRCKIPDFGGSGAFVFIKHHSDPEMLHTLCAEGFPRKRASDVVVEEVTKNTLQAHHSPFMDLVEIIIAPTTLIPRSIRSRERPGASARLDTTQVFAGSG